MARKISKAMAGILEELELGNTTYVDTKTINELAKQFNIKTSASVIASRLKEAGWLIPTGQRGVWEFAPASVAGPYSKNDPLSSIKAFRRVNPDERCFLCLQTAAWAQGYADRVPSSKEIAFIDIPRKKIPKDISAFKYGPNLEPVISKGVPCLQPESIIVHIASKPDIIKSWDSAMEWIPDIVYEINIEKLLHELYGRNDSVKRRTGYLLQSMFPEAANVIREDINIKSKLRFGPRTTSIRNNEEWKIVDTILPFNPKELEIVK